MTGHEVPRWALIATSIVCVACSEGSVPTTPSAVALATAKPIPSISPPTTASRPPATEADVYSFFSAASYPIAGYTMTSRFLIWKDGIFALQYENIATYWGTYTASGTALTFAWEGSNAASPWSATGTLIENVLTVRYNLVMQHSDFEDAVYRRASS